MKKMAVGSSTGRAIILICIASLLLNVLQFSRSMTASIQCEEQQQQLVRGGGGSGSARPCPPCSCSSAAAGDAKASSSAKDSEWNNNNANEGGKEEEPESAPLRELKSTDGAVGDEIGWEFGLALVPNKTRNTVYDPKNDAALRAHPSRYARSPVPKGSWRVRVGDNKWVTMDEVAFAYDVWFEENQRFQYMSWLGVYVQQDPIDAFAIQDMLWRVKPDLVIEIGTNTGGGAVFYSTIMRAYNPNAKIVTLDVVPEPRNWHIRGRYSCPNCILGPQHPYWKDGMITYIQGRVTEKATRDKVQPFVDAAKKVLVIEDASHRYPDTLENIEATYHWVSPGSYLLVQDTKMDRFVAGLGQKYGKYKFGPMRSVDEFIAKHRDKFVIDRRFEYLLYSQHHRGWLLRK